MSETPMADEYPPCDYCEHRDKPPVAEPCIDCERESAGKWSKYVPIFKVPAWGDVLHYLSTHRLWGLARVVNDGMARIRELERALTAERERADRAKAEGIKEGLRRAAEIAKQQNDEHAKNLSMGKGTWPQNDYIRDEIWHQWEGQEQASRWIANAILKEAGE